MNCCRKYCKILCCIH